ncbi:MAG: hypothetical protein PHQ58_02540 [Rhodoferax sp.]|uniref:hypothetical protein n=1 Tax=Rhodoferax sp. TaxID=50421 RepID=UPI00261CF642|nr:hypothetical protein [Rhodoferax sp.]MDD2879289.1 hypothetical protein [Rhodoferax sp.]
MNNRPVKLIRAGLLLLAGVVGFCNGLGAGEKKAFLPDEWTAVSEKQLDAQRGGFDVGAGLAVSFGLVRNVLVNGEMVHQTSFNLPDIGQITADQARVASAAIAESGLIQIGPQNFVDAGALSGGLTGTLIQNSLNDQQIQSLTIINTGVNSLGMLKAINIQTVLNDALTGALGSR